MAEHETSAMVPRVLLSGLGELAGDHVAGVARFLSVPYAAPPIGPRRWRPPEAAIPWSGTRCNPQKLPRCPQMSPKTATFKGYTIEESEDCLILNVWTPMSAIPSMREEGKSPELLPIIVYIHGGGGKFGHAHTRLTSGLQLAKNHQVCYIAVNYRLGIFGFLAHPELSAEDEERARTCEDVALQVGSGNYAMLDLVASLQWVQRYASQFGGDPARVTIWGLSSGAQYVAHLLVSPPAKGLFQRAMIQSAVDVSNIRKLRSSSDVWLGKSAEDWGCELGASMGCPKGQGQLAEMRKITAAKIARYSITEAATDCYESTIDPRCLKSSENQALHSAKPTSSVEALLAGNFHRVPVMLGYTASDGLGKEELEHTMFKASDVKDRCKLAMLMEREFGSEKDKLLAFYEQRLPSARDKMPESREVERILGSFSNDLWYYTATWHMADLLANASSPPPVFLYVFSALSRHSLHGQDASFWRGVEGDQISTQMAAYLINFAKSGDPNAAELPCWDAHTAGSRRFMQLGASKSAMEELAENEKRRHEFLVKQYFAKRLLSELKRGESSPEQVQQCRNGSAAESGLRDGAFSTKDQLEDAGLEPAAKKSRL